MLSLLEEEENNFFTRLVLYLLPLLAAGIWLFHRKHQRSRLYRMGNLLPGPDPVPFFGNALLALFKNPEREFI